MAVVDRGDPGRHRAVEENAPAAQVPFVPLAREQVQQLLAATDGEGRDQHIAAARPGLFQHLADFDGGLVAPPVQAVAVGRLHQHEIGARHRRRVAQDRRAFHAEVAGKHQHALATVADGGQFHARRTENVAGVAQHQPDPGQDLARVVVRHRAHLLQRPRHVVAGEQRRVVGAAVAAVAVVELGVAFGERGRVREHDPQQIGRRRMRPDRTRETARDQHRQPPAMVDVRVAQHDAVQRRDVERERVAVAQLVARAALDHPAVEQQPPAAGELDLVARARDFAGGAVEADAHHSASISSSRCGAGNTSRITHCM